MLEIRSVGKRYGTVSALDGIGLSVGPGEFFSLLGPSGCGKTTLLRMVAGFETPDIGEILLDGTRLNDVPPHGRACNMVFQRYALFPHLNVARNVAFGLEVKGEGTKADRARRVNEALALVQMGSFAHRAVETLSGGQQQRVAIARAVVNRPRLLLLDEPLAALDLKLRQKMQVELRALQRQLGMTFLYVTHAQDEALTLSDRVAVINQGKLEQVGTPQEIYRTPRSSFVASFIGSVNRLAGTVTGQSAVMLKGGAMITDLRRGADAAPLANGTNVVVLVRPEDVLLGGPDAAIKARVVETLYRGAHIELMSELPGDGGSVSLFVPGETVPPAKGATIGLRFRPGAALVMQETP